MKTFNYGFGVLTIMTMVTQVGCIAPEKTIGSSSGNGGQCYNSSASLRELSNASEVDSANFMASGNFIVTYKDATTASSIRNSLIQSAESQIVSRVGVAFSHISSHRPALGSILTDKNVLAVERDQDVFLAEDSEYEVQQNSANFMESTPTGVSRIRAPQARSENDVTGAGIKVAVLDTGIDGNHEDLSVAGGINYSGGSSSNWSDGHSHGTHVAGTICALDNSTGVVGVAPDCDLYAVKVLDDSGVGTDSQVVAGIEWAISNGMDVINLSLGRRGTASVAYERALQTARNNGILVVAAAGNNGNADNQVLYPASSDHTLAVAATDSSDDRAYYSSYGRQIDIAAPGGSVYSTLPNDNYGSKTGTSMSAPHVAGVAALLMEKHPNLTLEEIEILLLCGAEDVTSAGIDSETGYGLVNALSSFDVTSDCRETRPQAVDIGVDAFSVTRVASDKVLIKVTISDQNDDNGDGMNGSAESGVDVNLVVMNSRTGQYLTSGEFTTDENGQFIVQVENMECTSDVMLELQSFTKNGEVLDAVGTTIQNL